MKFLLISAVLVAVLLQLSTAHPKWRTSKGLKNQSKDIIPCDASVDGVQEWCDDVLGCLTLTSDWFHATRPLNAMPKSRTKINTQFILHTREHVGEFGDTFISADTASIDASTFDPSKPIKFITHGFVDNGNKHWMKDLAHALLNFGDYNVIRTDWGGGSLPFYCEAAANTRVVGLEIAYLVNFFIDNYGVDPANVHLLGHSLGSHVSGYAGEKIAGLGRISGLDPAGPYYTDTPTFIRLDETDAVYVDNIHSDSDSILVLGYGTKQAMGNLDFFPNGGHDQPGCDPVSIAIDAIIPGDIDDDLRDLAACSHQRAIFLFQDSLINSCPYVAYECDTYDEFQDGRCASCGDDNAKCAYMGARADEYPFKERINVNMFLDTDRDPHYCLYHYQIEVDTAHPHEAEDWVQGHIRLDMYGDNGEVLESQKITKEHERFDHGQVKSFMMTSHIDLSRVYRIDLRWDYDDTLTDIGSYCWMLLCNRALYLNQITISSMSYYPETNRLDHTTSLCRVQDDYTEIKSGHTIILQSDDACKP